MFALKLPTPSRIDKDGRSSDQKRKDYNILFGFRAPGTKKHTDKEAIIISVIKLQD